MDFYRGRDNQPIIAVSLELRPAGGGGDQDPSRGLQMSFSACSRGKAPPGATLEDGEYQRGPNIPLPFFAARDGEGRPTGKLDPSEAIRRLDWMAEQIAIARERVLFQAEHALELQEKANRAAREARNAALLSVPLGRIMRQQEQAASEPAPTAKKASKAKKATPVPDHAFEVGGTPPEPEAAAPANEPSGFDV